MFLGTGTMVICLKHVGITDLDRERWKMSVKTLASWSAHAHSTRPVNPSGPCGLANVDLFKGLIHIGCVITQSSGTAGALMHVSVLFASKRA